MANNIREWKSTFVGVVLFGIGIYQYLSDGSTEWSNHIEDMVLVGCGIGFILAPDRLLNFLFGWAKKKTGQ